MSSTARPWGAKPWTLPPWVFLTKGARYTAAPDDIADSGDVDAVDAECLGGHFLAWYAAYPWEPLILGPTSCATCAQRRQLRERVAETGCAASDDSATV